ncbi:MAG: G5 domain-containing protein [Candidatus Moraniibacteriota bacterium]
MKKIAKIVLPLAMVALLSVVLARFFLFPKQRTLDFSGEKTVTIDDEGLNYKINTRAKTVAELIGELKPGLSEKDELIPGRQTTILPGILITVNRQARINIAVDGKNFERFTLAKSVADALSENKVSLAPVDEIEPKLNTVISDGLIIAVTRKNTEETTVEEPIEFSVIKQKDSKVGWGEETVGQAGEEGIREVTYKIDYENGKEVKRVKLSSKITRRPTNKIVKIGTKLNVGKAASGIASWYNAGLNECASRDHAPGTWLRVTNSSNGKQIFVNVAGYGPQAGTGKLIDLDNKAFKQLAPLGQGTMKVKVEEVLNKGFKPEL